VLSGHSAMSKEVRQHRRDQDVPLELYGKSTTGVRNGGKLGPIAHSSLCPTVSTIARTHGVSAVCVRRAAIKTHINASLLQWGEQYHCRIDQGGEGRIPSGQRREQRLLAGLRIRGLFLGNQGGNDGGTR